MEASNPGPACKRTNCAAGDDRGVHLVLWCMLNYRLYFQLARGSASSYRRFPLNGTARGETRSWPALLIGVRQTLEGSFSAVSKRNFTSKYAFESSRRALHNALLCTALKSHFFRKNGRICENLRKFSEILRNSQFFEPIFCENFEIAAVQKDANLVELEKCCQTHIFLQNFVLIQPRASPPKNLQILQMLLSFPILLTLTPNSLLKTQLSRRARRRARRRSRRRRSRAGRTSAPAPPFHRRFGSETVQNGMKEGC